MPELDDQRDGPPFTRSARKALAEHEEPDQHHDGVAVVHHLRAYQPGKEQTENATGLWPRPTKDPNLVSLREMLSPVSEHDEHKRVQCAPVPHAVQLFVNAGTGHRRRGLDSC